ncbi:MAG: hypothetical protein NC131_01055 [Roseburia sp.]|nr:hypothetical protein [Roseburia sp.]
MKLTVGLNTKSIKEAVKALETVKKQLEGQILDELLKSCADWFIARSNEYVMRSDIGYSVKSGIAAEWEVKAEENGKKVVITNSHDKAVYVEFGVGVVGERDPHESAKESGYEYNAFSIFKDNEDAWQFTTTADELDLPQKAILSEYDDGSKILVRTMGATGVRYAYNALVDLHDYGAKEVWQQTKAKYWG